MSGRPMTAAERAEAAVEPLLRDEHAAASYAYDEALMAYEAALSTRDPSKRGPAEARLNEAARRLSAAQSAIAAARGDAPTFGALLVDPAQQLDPEGVVLASIRAYQAATSNTPSAALDDTEQL